MLAFNLLSCQPHLSIDSVAPVNKDDKAMKRDGHDGHDGHDGAPS
jgi:hypothetical protein